MRIAHRVSRFTVFHPFLFALYPVLSLLSRNLGQVPVRDGFRAMGVALLVSGGLLLALRLGLKDWHRAGLGATLAVILFYNFGLAGRFIHPTWLLVSVWAAIFVAGLGWLALRLRTAPAGATWVLNLAGGIALVSCLSGFVLYGVQVLKVGPVVHAQEPPASLPGASLSLADPPPDIYYIILDGHVSSDVLAEIYGVDNRHFIAFLEQRGFYVAADSHSNYDQTALSLSSSLNFNYLDARMDLLPQASYRGPLTELINDNDVSRFLKKAGYRTVAFNNGFPMTEMSQADVFLQGNDGLNNFEIWLLQDALGRMTLAGPILDSYRQRNLGMEAEIKSLVDDPRAGPAPKFVLAHFVLPHPPFVFNSDGSPRLSLGSGDGSHYSDSKQEYREGYRQQVQYTDRMVEQLVTAILARSQREPIIILQGDHGSGYYLDWYSQANSCLRERFSILNAYYLPGKKEVGLYPSITPVNSFRVVLNAYFKANLPLLPDRSFYSTWDRPYAMHEVTGQWEPSCAR